MENRESKEPSMEEILASIRRNILQETAPDAPPAAVAPAAPMPTARPAPAPMVEEEIIELTEMVPATTDGAVLPPRPRQSEAVSAMTGARPAPASGAMPEPELVARHVATAVVASISQLAILKPPAVEEPRSIGDGLLVETLVRQAAEPMIKDWLDRNLPAIVERAVKREVERIARKVELG